MRREISVYTEMFFRIYRNVFPYIHKYILAYAEILPLPNRGESPFAKRSLSRSCRTRRGDEAAENSTFAPVWNQM